jgi:peptidoglycan/LPS O-acetylase OafA/YrhL
VCRLAQSLGQQSVIHQSKEVSFMIPHAMRFPILIAVSLVVFIAVLSFVLRNRAIRPSRYLVVAISALVVVGGMLFAKITQNAGWPWWIYYTVPACITLLLPPVAFRLSWSELWRYLALAFLSAPAIHVAFSFFLDWHEYMPFINVPSLKSMLS